ncbi:hypothetical protein [Pseudobacteriovorax antillogorgiicola]|uniref:DUF8213 domain-containing protein n=1 Tax=Pseudobacteriovorax antillogorgiicola TaxID=1513793 RepID=A0A1Y6BPQ7_9BACT|nr:hypothetical protein [Pseudobacteriovorax antillogorgiicola]TCS53728.1 hypothetical protein EDD56_10737 [Pseudobacteriovorax antillogorgiicola]SMF22766.1 hypothetical protein SAMN06296036_107235 [Pseudobacteriovorax antillogorgiicola]
MLVICCLVLLLFPACGYDRGSTSAKDDTYRSEVYLEEYGRASFESEVDGHHLIHTTIIVNDKRIRAEFDEGQGIRAVEANISLDQNDKAILGELFHRVKASVDQSSPVQTYTSSLTNYLSEAPEGHTIPTRGFEDNLSLYDEGVTCIWKGQGVYGQWDTAYGEVRGEWVTTNAHYGGNYGCMGRCGANCGWGAPSSYTKDCMDHDICSRRHNASGGGGDRNCGDEFNQAMDDWVSGVIRGCSG